MAVEEYLLRFDLEKLRSQVADVRQTYTDFGQSLHTLVSDTSDELSNLQQRATSVSSTLSGLTPQLERSSQSIRSGMGATSVMLDSMSKHSEKIANDMTRLSGIKLGGLESSTVSPKMREELAKVQLIEDMIGTSKTASKEVQAVVARAVKDIKEADMASAKAVKNIQSYFKSEMDAASSQVKGVLSHVPGGVMGRGFLGGLIAAMVYGYVEGDRLKAQSGEILNIFEATGESLTTKSSKRVRGFFSDFQERARRFYGISLQETQSVLKSMVEAGYKGTDIELEYDKTLKEVGKNVTVASIALDKHFNQQTGTSMTNILKITTELGDSLETATDKYIKLAFAGQRSGMGISKFVDAVLSGASAMQQYGVDVADVAAIMGTIKKHYEDMGLSEQYAGGQAQQVIGGLTTGLANLSPSMRAVLMRSMFPELSDLDAYQKWEDGFKRVASGEGSDFGRRVMVELQRWATRGSKSRAQSIRKMEYEGIDNRTAATVIDLSGKIDTANDLKALNAKETAAFKDALKTERQRISELHQTQERLSIAIKDIGQGLLKILVGLVGVIASGLKAIPSIISAALDKGAGGGLKRLEGIAADLDMLQKHIGSGVAQGVRGFEAVGDAAGKEIADDLRPLIKVLSAEPGISDGGGSKVPTNIEEAVKMFKELGGTFSDLLDDPEFRKQAWEQFKGTAGGVAEGAGEVGAGIAEWAGSAENRRKSAESDYWSKHLLPGGPFSAPAPPEERPTPSAGGGRSGGPASTGITVKKAVKSREQKSKSIQQNKATLEADVVETSRLEKKNRVAEKPN